MCSMKQLKILFVVYELPPLGGGVARAADRLLWEFSKQKDLEVTVVTSSLVNKFEREKYSKNIDIYRIPIGNKSNLHTQTPFNMVLFTVFSFLTVFKLLLTQKFDLSHYFGYPSALPGLLCRPLSAYIVSLRGVDVPGYNKKFGWYYKIYKPMSALIWKFADRVTVNSQQLALLAKKTLGRDFEVIHNGVDTDLFRPLEERKKFKKFTITAGGTIMGPKKGLEYLIKGFADFHSEVRGSQLVLFGSGELMEDLRKLVSELGLENSVVFRGKVDSEELARELPKCHVFCLPSLAEGMSNATLEAAACGLPLVITDVGGTRELLEYKNGIIIDKKSSNAIKNSLLTLYKDDDLRENTSVSSRQLAKKYSWEVMAEAYMGVYGNTA